jgi:hypothetical protein
MWYAGPDTPAPPAENADRVGLSITIAVQPPSPGNSVAVQYRVDGGTRRHLAAHHLRSENSRHVQYFLAKFPNLSQGSLVEYCPIFTRAGRQVPAPADLTTLPSRFRLAEQTAPTMPAEPEERPLSSRVPRFTPRLEFISTIMSTFSSKADVLGETPQGLRINYYLEGGVVIGPRLSGKVLPRGGDLLTIRRDGVGVVFAHALYQSDDGALIGADYIGFLDLGEDAYSRAARGDFPELVALQLAPTLTTAHPRYLWMNRIQFAAVGQVRRTALTVEYDLFALHNDASPAL